MECETEDPSACVITRQCNLEGEKPAANAIAGVAISVAKRLIIIGDAKGHRLLGYNWHSCFDARQSQTWTIPGQMRSLGNVAIDSDETLWLAMQVPDYYLNASAFAWQKGAW